jgi:glycosyltransferase involved in cell wall biosynthesis
MSDAGPIDCVISLRFPAYAVRHAHHVCWLNHTMREYYDLWPRLRAGLGRKGRLKEGVRRRLIHTADRFFMRPSRMRLFAISQTVAARVDRWLHLKAEPLHPPPPQREYRCEGYGDYIFAVSRLHPLKRMHLLVQALAEPAARGVRCVIAGDGEDASALQRLARDLGVESRVSLIGAVDEAALLDHLARCRGVAFVPQDEDYGFVTVEAFSSSKPVVTCTDSGGPTEFVSRGGGLIVAPTPAAIADALSTLSGDTAEARRLGEAGRAQIRDLTWPAAVDRLLRA